MLSAYSWQLFFFFAMYANMFFIHFGLDKDTYYIFLLTHNVNVYTYRQCNICEQMCAQRHRTMHTFVVLSSLPSCEIIFAKADKQNIHTRGVSQHAHITSIHYICKKAYEYICVFASMRSPMG